MLEFDRSPCSIHRIVDSIFWAGPASTVLSPRHRSAKTGPGPFPVGSKVIGFKAKVTLFSSLVQMLPMGFAVILGANI